VGGGAAKFGDDLARSFRGADDVSRSLGGTSDQPIGGGVLGGLTGGTSHFGSAPHVESQVDTFVAHVADGFAATPESAREASLSVACNVLLIASTERRLPTNSEWVDIGTDAVIFAGIEVPVGSGAWLQLERVKDAVGDAVSDSLGLVDDAEADSVADELACAWA
jgi:hypothetical protein